MVDRKRTIVLGGLLVLAAACQDEAAGGSSPEATPAGAAGADAEGTDAKAVEPAKAVEAPPAEPPPSGHAVAKVGSLLFFSSTGDVGFELPPLGSAPGMTVNVVGEQDGRLVVETLVTQPAEHHCAATLDGLSDFRLRLHLAESDLLPVLTEDVVHEPGDGTTVRLGRGVPVPSGSRELLVRGTPVRVPVPAERLGRFYQPGQPFAAEGSDGRLYPLEGHALTYGGQALAEEHLYREGGSVLRFGATERTGDALVTVRNPCLEVVALASTERLHAMSSGGLYAMKLSGGSMGLGAEMEEGSRGFLVSPYGSAFAAPEDDEDVWGGLTGTEVGEAFGVGGLGLVGAGATTKRYEVKAGAAITWADGRPAGQVTADHRFDAAPRDEGGRSCFDAPLALGQATNVTLCFAPGDVGELEAPTGFGTIGLGSGSEAGSSGISKGSTRPIPLVLRSKATVKGSLDKDIIRRIMRAHINEVRYCYNQGLARDPSLAGKVSIQFTIGASGSVSIATVASSTLADESVSECIAKAVKRWTFPKPKGGGVVSVTYPFVLEPG